MAFKTGKRAPKFHPKTLSLSKYFLTKTPSGILPVKQRWLGSESMLPDPATKVYREYKTPPEAIQMYGNDQFGDCVWAMMANFIILATVHTGSIIIPTLDDVLGAYSAVTGFDRNTGANDNGTAITDALAYMCSTGMAGVKFLAWAQIDHTNLLHRHIATDLFGATLVGVQLPQDAQLQFANGQNWEVSDSAIEGGHAILHPGYGSEGDDYVSWAKWDQKAGAAWSSKYIDEEYVVITDAWIDQATQQTPGGLDIKTLQSDLKLLQG